MPQPADRPPMRDWNNMRTSVAGHAKTVDNRAFATHFVLDAEGDPRLSMAMLSLGADLRRSTRQT
jgi:hypothetical protein